LEQINGKTMKLEGRSIKDIEQNIAFQNYLRSGSKGAVIAGTGFGKTRVGVIAAEDALNCNHHDVLILVPFEHLKDRFREEFKKTGREELLEKVEFHCYASAKKVIEERKNYSAIICDEIHLGLTDKCFELYKLYMDTRMLFLTATLPEDPTYRMRLHVLVPTVYTITLDECVEKGLVAPYSIECLGVELTEREAKDYKKVNSNFGYWKQQLGFDAFKHAQRVLANKKKYSKLVKAAVGFYRAIRQRKEIVDHANNKISVASRLTEEYEGKILVFGGDNAFTDLLAEGIDGSVVYHSARKAKEKREALQKFKDGRAYVLCSTKALNQGLDVPDAGIGLICGLTSKALTMIQRVGRLVRIDPENPEKSGKVVVVYVKDSQEEKWLRSALKNIDRSNISWKDADVTIEAQSSLVT